MATDFILTIDQGTTNTKALALDASGNMAARGTVSTPIRYPRPGWVEQSGDEIWIATRNAVEVCVDGLGAGARIATLGISNQRETVLLWHRSTGETVGPCITWQCRRSADRIDRIRAPGTEETVAALTGLDLDPLFPAAKLGWLLDEVPGARALAERDDLCAGTIDSWLLFRLTEGAVHATDAGNASRTQLFDIHAQRWSEDLCALFGIPMSILPEVRDSDSAFGAATALAGAAKGVPIRAAMGDSHAALFGHGIRAPGQVKATYGTGSSLMTLTDVPLRSRSGLSTTVAWRRGGHTSYALEGNISVSAQAAAWTVEMLGLPNVEALTELARSVDGSNGVTLVPAFVGMGAPHWRPEARAAISGLTLGSTRGHIARATFEAIALQIRDVFVAMERDLGQRLDRLSVDGGATRNDFLMQIEADVLDRPVKRVGVTELSAFGAGVMAGAASGVLDEAEVIARHVERGDTLRPSGVAGQLSCALAGWERAVASVIAFAGE